MSAITIMAALLTEELAAYGISISCADCAAILRRIIGGTSALADKVPPLAVPSIRPGPPAWPYSMANARANNVIWRLCKGVSPQQIYDALDAEGLAIIEKPLRLDATGRTEPAPDAP